MLKNNIYILFILLLLVSLLSFGKTEYGELDLSTNKIYIKSKITDSINIWSTAFQENANKLDNSQDYINKSKKNLAEYITKYRSNNNLLILSYDVKLDLASQWFAIYLSETWLLTHYDDNWKDWSYRISQQWLPFSYRWEIVSSSIDFSWAIQSRKDSKWHRNIFNSNQYNSFWVWYYKWIRVVLYYYKKDLNKNITTIKLTTKNCVARKYKYIKKIKTKVSCTKYK